MPLPIQDAGATRQAGQMPLYHIHGRSQYYGTCKLHRDPACPHLQHWRPEKHRGHRLAKALMREWVDSYETVPIATRCRTCWPETDE